MNYKFKPGDVIVLKRNNSHLKKGDIGVVLEYSSIPFVKWNKYNKNNHTANFKCIDGYGHSVNQDHIELYKPENKIKYKIY
jgi:hypothetical protein